MADDIGPGDVVECIPHVVPWKSITVGERYRVLLVERDAPGCSCGGSAGIDLVEREPDPFQTYCIHGFRKIGGSQADTVRRFAEDLAVKAPAEPKTVTA